MTTIGLDREHAAVAIRPGAGIGSVTPRSPSSSGHGRLARLIADHPLPVMLFEPPGHPVLASPSARTAIDAAGDIGDAHDILGVGWAALCDAAVAPPPGGLPVRAPRIPGGGGRARVSAILDACGAAESLLVVIEPAPVPALMHPDERDRVESPTGPHRDGRQGHATPGGGPAPAPDGRDPALRRTLGLAERFAATDVPVLLLAETGAGKDRFARWIHARSRRESGPFIALNCGGLASGLLESELFGHAPGAFTGARPEGADGRIAAADGGTLFLDEVAEMPPPLQSTLLRVLEDGTYHRVGDAVPRRADIRIIAATWQNLTQLVSDGVFRRDLFYRIRGAAIHIPPLRARTDIDHLAGTILRSIAAEDGRAAPALTPEAAAVLADHPWPGNIRELRTALHHAVILAGDEPVIRVEHLPADIIHSPTVQNTMAPDPTSPPADAATCRLDDARRDAVARAIDVSGGNISRAARRLGVSRSTLYRLIDRLELR